MDLAAESGRTLEQRIHAIKDQLQHLPRREPGESGGNMGMFVTHFNKPTSALDTITIDLEKIYPVDQIVLVPTRLENIERKMETVGFPIRFDIQGAETEDFSNPVYFYKGADRDYPEPNGYPIIFQGNGQRIRYLRLVVYDMAVVKQLKAFLLSELYIFSNGRNVALKKEIQVIGSLHWINLFSKDYLVDGHTSLGQPLLIADEPLPAHGWHAKMRKKAKCTEFVELHFEKEYIIEEVRLYPVYDLVWPKGAAFGFPIHLRLRRKEKNSGWKTINDWSKRRAPDPANSAVFMPIINRKAKVVRLEALTLPESAPSQHIFALAEMEVYSGGTNIAPLGTVVSSSLYKENPERWNEQALTDGYTARGKIIPLLSWLEGLAQRGKLETELAVLTEQLKQKKSKTARILNLSVRVLSGLLLLAGCMMIYNYKKRRKQLQKLKNEIASDLHDEVGSNLASITILAASEREQSEPRHAEGLQKIVDIAKETSVSMQDIVWMLHPDRKTNMSLTKKLQYIASSLLVDINFDFTGPEDLNAKRLSMDKLHHLLLFYKEVLHNLVRHSDASQVNITLRTTKKGIRLEIIDNGTPPSSGSLPEGPKLRAEKMNGHLNYQVGADYNHLTLDIS